VCNARQQKYLKEKAMSANCCDSACASQTTVNPRYRKALWVALIINAVMFVVEIVGGLKSGSVSLLADSVDFAGDAANYGISLAVLSMGLAWRSRAAMVKGLSMAAFGLFVLAKTGWAAINGISPEPITMGAIAVLALLANGGVALMLYAYRDGDANMRSVWLCSRNDAIGNVAVMLAAAGVSGTGSGWPDLLVAVIMASLALSSGIAVTRQASQELTRHAESSPSAPSIVPADKLPD
jgi:cation diffusion facilitator family transporter